MRDLEGRVAVVTGAGSGIGRSIALALARRGVDIVVSDIEAHTAQQVQAEVEALGVRAIAVATDVADAQAVARLADIAFDTFGKVDILVNNAGVTLPTFRAAWDHSLDDFRWIINVNLFGVIHGVTAFVPRMRRQPGEKHIVNTSSIGGIVTVPGLSSYVASKMAVTGFSDTIREELAGDRIGVTVLIPGSVHSNIFASERLRPPAEQSEARNVPAFVHAPDVADDVELTDVEGGVALQDAGDIARTIDAEQVGPMVVQAILDNAPYCMTHPAPVDAIRKTADRLSQAYKAPPQAG